jgi:hypothetical protein
MNGRVYDPVIARFLSVDPDGGELGSSQRLNPYSYVRNRPLVATDPTGWDDNESDPTDVGDIPIVANLEDLIKTMNPFGNAGEDQGDTGFDGGYTGDQHGPSGIGTAQASSAEGSTQSQVPLPELGLTSIVVTASKVAAPQAEIDLVPDWDARRNILEIDPAADFFTKYYGSSNYKLQSGLYYDTTLFVVGVEVVANRTLSKDFDPIQLAPGGAAFECAIIQCDSEDWTRATGWAIWDAFGGELVRGGVAAARGGAAVVRAGQKGEAAVRAVYNIGPKIGFTTANGVSRIPDGLTATVLSEVKNVRSLSYTQQLRDFAAFAKLTGRRFDLYVPSQNTPLYRPLRDAIRTGDIILKYIP